MPELSRFYGIVIRMYYADHAPPHFHATYQGEEAVVAIGSLAVLHGHLPARAHGLVVEWASLPLHELREAWERREHQEPTGVIDPLP